MTTPPSKSTMSQKDQTPTPSRPSFRSAQMIREGAENEVISREFYAAKPSASETERREPDTDDEMTGWSPGLTCRPVPPFYPLEQSSRFVEDELTIVAARLSDALRILSVQAIYHNNATANLMTSESVEMHLSLWRTNGGQYPDGIVVELQRRKGCSITFHRYSRHILDAAVGDFDVKQRAEDIDRSYSRKVERLLTRETANTAASEQENAVIAVEIAHGLLMKDRMDARQLGLESLCLLTDPRKTGPTTAIIASRIVLLGTAQGSAANQDDEIMFDEAPFQEIRETILSLVQFRRIGDEEDFSEDDAEREEADFIDDDDMEGRHPEEKEHLIVLHNLALAVMANALDVIEKYDSYDTDPENRGPDTSKTIANAFMAEADQTSKREILSTLIQELGKAHSGMMGPHNACLSAKCIRSLCRASADARKRARQLGLKNVVNTALDVGVRTHAKLETECRNIEKVLTETQDDDEE